jgi:hypothetical protein
MKKTADPMLAAFHNRDDRAKVDEILLATYGPQKVPKSKVAKDKKAKKNMKKKNQK